MPCQKAHPHSSFLIHLLIISFGSPDIDGPSNVTSQLPVLTLVSNLLHGFVAMAMHGFTSCGIAGVRPAHVYGIANPKPSTVVTSWMATSAPVVPDATQDDWMSDSFLLSLPRGCKHGCTPHWHTTAPAMSSLWSLSADM